MMLQIKFLEMEKFTNIYHNPVLLNESIKGLNINPSGIYVDATFGSGGHSQAILQHLDKDGRLYAFDQDADAIANKMEDKRLTMIHANFQHIKKFLRLHNVNSVDGILADLGVSSHQFDSEDRGFSTRWNSHLDMRMDRRKETTAEIIINNYEQEDLKRIFRTYGEIGNANKLARLIVENRKDKITHTQQLNEIIALCIPKHKENKYLAQVYQALRIEVNKELEALKGLLLQSKDILKEKGRLVIISYHSLEDRMVKQFMRSGNLEDKIEKDFYGNPLTPFVLISKKAIVPSEEEIRRNSRSRSAKLRIAEKKEEHGK